MSCGLPGEASFSPGRVHRYCPVCHSKVSQIWFRVELRMALYRDLTSSI